MSSFGKQDFQIYVPEVKIKLQSLTLISKVHFAKQIDVIIKNSS